MTVRLRAHHLLCMLTYVGKGYTPAFTANYDRIVARLGAGEPIEIVEGPDDVCAPRFEEAAHHCLNESVAERDVEAARDIGARLGLPIEPGASFRLDDGLLAAMRRAFSSGSTRTACEGCEWAGLCGSVSAAGYPKTRLRAHPVLPEMTG